MRKFLKFLIDMNYAFIFALLFATFMFIMIMLGHLFFSNILHLYQIPPLFK
jgi:hypothetical protein